MTATNGIAQPAEDAGNTREAIVFPKRRTADSVDVGVSRSVKKGGFEVVSTLCLVFHFSFGGFPLEASFIHQTISSGAGSPYGPALNLSVVYATEPSSVVIIFSYHST